MKSFKETFLITFIVMYCFYSTGTLSWHSEDVYLATQKYILQKASCPEKIKFPSDLKRTFHVKKISKNEYEVFSWFEVTDDKNNKLRVRFYCTVTKKDDSHWQIENFDAHYSKTTIHEYKL